MNFQEQMQAWLDAHPNATVQEAWAGGYFQSNANWCKNKVNKMAQVVELLKDIIE